MKQGLWSRRSLVAGLGGAATFILGTRAAGAQAQAQSPSAPFQPPRHDKDMWFDKVPGKHRLIVDTTSADGTGNAIQFANNFLAANKAGYSLDEGDLAVVVSLRHFATAFAFTDTIWAKYGKALSEGANYTPPKSGEIPVVNPYNGLPRSPLTALAKRGIQFSICNLATRRISRQVAGPAGDAEAVYKELLANAIPNGHFMPAGVVAVTRAQEYGYSLLFVG